MEDPIISEELIEAFRPIMEMNNAQFRQVRTMLAGFIATHERDLKYMDEYMDTLFDFMDPQSDTEMLMRQYCDYIATFDEKEAKVRICYLDSSMGYMTKIVYAAGLVAQNLHKGQTDKGGNDYLESHLLKVAARGLDWKEKVVGFLHDAAEDCNVTVDDVMAMFDTELSKITENPKENWYDEEWWEDWMEDIDVYPCTVTNTITDAERKEIITALNLLNHHTASSREEYINRISENRLALRVKMHDLENNMDLSRIPQPTEKDLARLERYKVEYQQLLNALKSRIEL